jgi:hypothetical protein
MRRKLRDWLNRFRRLLDRWEKQADTYLASFTWPAGF